MARPLPGCQRLMPTREPITNIMDLREAARRRVPRAFFEYADRGSYEETTLRENRAALDRLQLRQRVMCNVDERSLATQIIGQNVSMPLAIAPTGLTGLQHGSGEIHGARAAAKAGIPFCLSTMSICSIEQVRAATDTPFWFQIYVMRDRGFTRELIQRAVTAKCSALMLTADLTVQGQRHREIKNGLSVPPKITLRNVLDIASKPRWAWHVLQAPSRSFGNLEDRIGGADSLTTLAQWIASQFDPTLNWQDLGWIRELWPGKLILKGIMDAADARLAAEYGVDAIVVSNHGGRQLDGAPASIDMLAGIVDAVAGSTEVLVDSGITSGQDLLKALALGARAGLIGKAFLYGLGAGGEAGVTQAIDIIRRELSVSMALTGQRDARHIDPAVILRR
ncbi:L-lactate dehydrogenase (cytochrome) [Rhodanobacter sp. ANJX3]|uniref:alpha-hydroxy acid oxidase n=1 Tax=unclassified Rhodanobacter TaxID=2621553 RepID=UPI0017E7014E|nr:MULTISPECIES: alpha-hydroxy acid oxidase [unclassified Rhodanobacter]MBB5358345.1 L-lactate dehydrogenase (cytochrome) [Rhodanobacter sp. ANJX3]NYE27826.1 L-lactate dehydrogenase (cytochrome) [Rhodanobacter sp. K2T2]